MRVTVQLFLTFYAVFILVMGFYGYQQTGSLASLLSGGTLGLALLVFSYFFYKRKKWAAWLATFATTLLFFTFLYRFNKTMQFLPVIMAIISGVMLYYLILFLYNQRKGSS